MKQSQFSDQERVSFLQALDKAWTTVDLNEWESSFLESNLTRSSFSPKQRESIDLMIERHRDKIKW